MDIAADEVAQVAFGLEVNICVEREFDQVCCQVRAARWLRVPYGIVEQVEQGYRWLQIVARYFGY